MTAPKVTLTVLDNQLGIRPPTAGKMMAIIAPAISGDTDTPAIYARTKDVETAFGGGPLVELAAYALERYGKPVVLVRCKASTDGSYGTLTLNVSGTSVISKDALTSAADEYEPFFQVVKGGTVGTAGITFQWSLDGGRTLSPVTALGTANSFTFPGSGGVKIDFAAGTLVSGDNAYFRATPALWSNSDLTDALNSLGLTQIKWEYALVFGPFDDTAISAAGAALTAMELAGKPRWIVGNVRGPNEGETEAAYRTAMETLLAAAADRRISLWGGYAKVDSSIGARRRYRRAVCVPVAPRFAVVDPHIDIADIDLGALPGVRILDANLNPDEHNEETHPGLDDLRLGTLKTHEGYEGVYVTNPRLISPTGSDFVWVQYRRVVDIACDEVRAALTRRLSKSFRVDKATGFVLEEDAVEIEGFVNARLRNALTKRGWVTSALFILNRDDNILSTSKFTGKARVIPLGYAKFFEVDVGLFNPALATQAIAA